MTFMDIPDGTSLFVDANTFIYHFTPYPQLGPACRQLMQRVRRNQILAFTSSHVLSDVAHRLMTLEAIRRFGWPMVGIARRLRTNPMEVAKLSSFRKAVERIAQSSIQFLSVAPALVVTATALSQQHGLLSGDALILAVMQQHGLIHLASHDDDFDRVPGLTRYAPE